LPVLELELSLRLSFRSLDDALLELGDLDESGFGGLGRVEGRSGGSIDFSSDGGS